MVTLNNDNPVKAFYKTSLLGLLLKAIFYNITDIISIFTKSINYDTKFIYRIFH